ncbi:MAG TPA: alpha-L-arabinofuranosidase C-terminal domain-containing protein, partial [Opitutaceae bacterium]|nr:alpha-L-arabinofuranosidase C-terminal domain-containing protein [Opitutaceae bacterium]
SYGSPAYYAQVMFASHVGDVTPKSELKADPNVFLPYSITRQTSTGKVFLKVVNPSATAQSVKLVLAGLKNVLSEGETTTLSSQGPTETNTITEPTKIVPVVRPLKNVAAAFEYTFPAWSITVLEMNTR